MIQVQERSDLDAALEKWKTRLHSHTDGIFLSLEERQELASICHFAQQAVVMWEWLENQTRVDIGEDENGDYEVRANDTNYYTLEKVVGRAMRGESDTNWEKL